ncbi:2-oxoacid:acceptor oxidoreductase family protein [Chloroflexota bacterium]
MRTYNVLLCGVGGTGVIGFGTLLKQAAVYESNILVQGNELRGRAQRGGATYNTVRYTIMDDEEVFDERKRISGDLPRGNADLMISAESGETLRNLKYVSSRTDIIINNFQSHQVGIPYPDMEKGKTLLEHIARRVIYISASEMSMNQFGSYNMTNYILLGAALKNCDIPVSISSINQLIVKKNEKEALELGFNCIATIVNKW